MALPLSPAMPPRAQRALVRQALMARISDQVPNWQRSMFNLAADETPNDGPYYLLARAVMDGLQVTCWKNRLAFAVEAPVIRYCGAACAATMDKRMLAGATILATAGEFRDSLLIPCSKQLYVTYGPRAVDAAVGHFCFLVDMYVDRAADFLHAGFADPASVQPVKGSVAKPPPSLVVSGRHGDAGEEPVSA